MPSYTSGRDTSSVGFHGDEISLARRDPRGGYSDLSDYPSRWRLGSSAMSRSGQHGLSGASNSETFGWSRWEPVRLGASIFLRDPGNPLNRCYGSQDSPNYSNVADRGRRNGDPERISHLDHTGLGALSSFLAARPPPTRQFRPDVMLENDVYEPGMPMEKDRYEHLMQLRNGLHGQASYMHGALSGPDFDTVSNLNSLDSVSQYSLQHLYRLRRPYYYQPPYVEDHESEFDELRQLDELDSLLSIMTPTEFNTLLLQQGDFLPDPADTEWDL
jgi:hypothetical protein